MPRLAGDRRLRAPSAPGERRIGRLGRGLRGGLRPAVGALLRLILFIAIVWSFTGPASQLPLVTGAPEAGAAGLVPGLAEGGLTAQGAIPFPETGYMVGSGPLGSYFMARGGARTFGPPISNQFTLLGGQVQIFRFHLLRQEPSGEVTTVNLFDLGAIPSRDIGTAVLPEIDPALQNSAPLPGSPNYAGAVQAFIREHAPDVWEGQPVGFYRAFLDTVRFEDAYPGGTGDRGLLPGMAHEIWGVPLSRPTPDPRNPDLVYLRWERGVMAWSRQTGAVTAVPLGEVFKAVLTGQGLSPELAAQAAGSRFFRQADPAAPGGVARPAELPDTALTDAFVQNPAAISAAAAANPDQMVTPTPSWYPPNQQLVTPTPGPGMYNPGYGLTTPTATPWGYVPPAQPGVQPTAPTGLPGSGIQSGSGAALPPGTPGSDPCFGDEQITYSPELPRVGNELLIAVTSSRPHPYGRLAGTERTQFVRERPGQKGYVWEWTIQPSYPGDHEYTFYVDSTIPCQKIQISVRQALATSTPKPTKTPTPWNWNGNDNNSNSNNNDNTNNGRAPSINPSSYVTAGQDWYNCNAFQSQRQAQEVLRYDPTDPNRLDAEDGSQDGVACRNYTYWQYPNDRDETPVPRQASQAPTSPPTATLGASDPNDRYNCIDFPSQAAAQAVLRADPSDPNKLDISSPSNQNAPDGIACNTMWDAPEWAAMFYYPEPHDLTPVPRGTSGSGGSNGANATPTPGTPQLGTPTPVLSTPIIEGTPVNDAARR